MKPSSDQDWQTDRDASTLQDHAEITADPKRHAAAHKKLKAKAKTATAAVASSKDNMKKGPPTGAALHQKVKSGLKRAFPDSN